MTLTGHGRDVLEGARRPGAGSDRQAFYVGITKPRELAHDSRVYSAYMKAAERLAERGEPVRRVVLEEELKREYQRFLQAENRARREGGETPEERSDAVARWAQEHQLPYEDGHVQFPDARLEYDDRDGRRSVEDIEVVTPHYRGAHAAAKVRSGFTRYRAIGARLGGLRTTGTKRSWRGPAPRRGAAAVTLCGARPRRRGEGLHRASGRLPGDRHAALRRLRRSPVPASTLGSSTARRSTTSSASLVAKK